MTAKVWESAVKLSLNIEGGLSLDKDDKGNWTGGKVGVGELKGTNHGISAAAYPNEDIANLTPERAKELYRRDYWDKNKCDYLPDWASIAVFDFSINSGVKPAAKEFQKALGVKIDGVIGNQTIGAANRIPPRKVLEDYMNLRIEYMQKSKMWWKYKNGWTDRVHRVKQFCEELI